MKNIVKMLLMVSFPALFYTLEAQEKVVGRYSSNTNPFIRIDFYSDSSFTEYIESGDCLDYPFSYILSYGTYWKNKQYYVITSSPRINLPDSNQDSILINSFIIANQDSLIIEINSPYEQLLKQSEYVKKIYFYIVDIECENDSISQEYEENLKKKHTYFYTNRIAFYKPPEVKVKEIRVSIYAKFNDDAFGYRELVACNFKCNISNPSVNYVIIELPFFTYSYLYYSRYQDYYIKILNKRQILFNGDIYSNKEYWDKIMKKKTKERMKQLHIPFREYWRIIK